MCRQKIAKSLFRRGTELQTALKIKNSGWNERKTLEFLVTAAESQPPSHRLHTDTISTLQSHISNFGCAVSRHLSLKYLSKLGQLNQEIVADTHFKYNAFDMAIASGYLRSVNNAKLERLIGYGSITDISTLMETSNHTPGPKLQNQLIQAAIAEGNFHIAKALWKKTSRQCIPFSTTRNLFIMATKHQDLEFLAELEPLIPCREDIPLAKQLLDHTDNIGLILSSLRSNNVVAASEPLTRNLLEVLAVVDNEPTRVYNAILKGVFDRYTSLFVFSVYRFLRTKGLMPDGYTTQILANAAHRLGNSKALSYEIWRENVLEIGVQPTRKLCETMIQSQFSGVGTRTALYYLYEMHTRGIYLRNHIHYSLLRQFGDDPAYKEIFGDVKRNITQYSRWDPTLAYKEAGRYAEQAERNRREYLRTKTLDDLREMLEFERNLGD